jgi:hypothetical protein
LACATLIPSRSPPYPYGPSVVPFAALSVLAFVVVATACSPPPVDGVADGLLTGVDAPPTGTGAPPPAALGSEPHAARPSTASRPPVMTAADFRRRAELVRIMVFPPRIKAFRLMLLSSTPVLRRSLVAVR